MLAFLPAFILAASAKADIAPLPVLPDPSGVLNTTTITYILIGAASCICLGVVGVVIAILVVKNKKKK